MIPSPLPYPARGSRFHIVDVFGTGRFTGNPLAVVELAESVPDGLMQALAAEFNFAETTFVLPPAPGTEAFPVRIFTPRREVPFAGHPVLGTAHVIRTAILRQEAPSLVLDLKAGPVPVRFEPGPDPVIWLSAPAPTFGAAWDGPRAAALAGLGPEDLDPRFPVEEADVGIPFLLLPVRGLDALARARVDAAACARAFPDGPARPLFLFCPEARDRSRHAACRVFAPSLGIPEDPATGSAAACLAAYCLRHGYLGGDPLDTAVEQGWEMGRNSVLHLRARREAGGPAIGIGGRVADVAEGILR